MHNFTGLNFLKIQKVRIINTGGNQKWPIGTGKGAQDH